MSINAINSVSLYEYYYSIGDRNKEEKKTSPLEEEMREYGLTPTDSEAMNVALLKQAKAQAQEATQQTIPNYERPWADLMYQLNLSFNDDPKDDIDDIKEELNTLLLGIDDKELEQEISDLKSYVETLYLSFQQTNLSSYDNSALIGMQLSNMSMMNQINLS